MQSVHQIFKNETYGYKLNLLVENDLCKYKEVERKCHPDVDLPRAKALIMQNIQTHIQTNHKLLIIKQNLIIMTVSQLETQIVRHGTGGLIHDCSTISFQHLSHIQCMLAGALSLYIT